MNQLVVCALVVVAFHGFTTAFKLNASFIFSSYVDGGFIVSPDGNVYVSYITQQKQLRFSRIKPTGDRTTYQIVNTANDYIESANIFFSSNTSLSPLIVSLNTNSDVTQNQPVNIGLNENGQVQWRQPWASEASTFLFSRFNDVVNYHGIAFDQNLGTLIRVSEKGDILWRTNTAYSNYSQTAVSVDRASNEAHILLTSYVKAIQSNLNTLLTVNIGTGEIVTNAEMFQCADPDYEIIWIRFFKNMTYLFCRPINNEPLYQVVRVDSSGLRNWTTVPSAELQSIDVAESGIVVISYFSQNFCLHYHDLLLRNTTRVCHEQILLYRLQVVGTSLYTLVYAISDIQWDDITLEKSRYFILKLDMPVDPIHTPVSPTETTFTSPTEPPNINSDHKPAPLLSTSNIILISTLSSSAAIFIFGVLVIYLNRRRANPPDVDSGASVFATSTNASVFTTGGTVHSIFSQATTTAYNSIIPISIPGYLLVKQSDFELGTKLFAGGAGAIHVVKLLSDELKSRARGNQSVAKLSLNLFAQHRERLQLEIAVLHYLNQRSDNFVRLIGFEENNLTILMDFYRHGSLKRFMTLNDWTKSSAVMIPLDVASGLLEMHQLGIAHCDIKLDNILIDFHSIQNRYIGVIADLGLARVVTDRTRGVHALKAGWSLGLSIQYAAPEILALYKYKQSDGRSSAVIFSGDVYAFGVVVFQCACRKPVVWQQAR